MSEKLDILFVGLGGWGRNWVKNIVLPHPGVNLVGVVDREPGCWEELKKICNVDGISYFSQLDEALEKTEVPALVIAGGAKAHPDLITRCLEAKKHFLVEKPLADSIDRAMVAEALYRKSDRVGLVSQNYRFYPVMEGLKKMLSENKYGRLGSLSIQFRKRTSPVRRKSYPERLPGYPFGLDMAIHHMDLLRYISSSEAVALTARTFNPPWVAWELPQSLQAQIEMEDGIQALYQGNWISNGPPTAWFGDWEMEFERGYIQLRGNLEGRDEEQNGILVAGDIRGGSDTLTLEGRTPDSREKSLSGFIDSVKRGRGGDWNSYLVQKGLSDVSDNLKSLAMVFALQDSGREGRSCRISEYLGETL